ncbi:unnamed protein product [marine sediment metagenome]|uniref:CopG-like ribbon-helix-helix domain-containing protein n=1 Tax=marine sediment metagenome TaxID=412755 RepID=X0Z2I7_9ZZZZ
MKTNKLPVISVSDEQKDWLTEEKKRTGETYASIVRGLIKKEAANSKRRK